LNGSVLELPEIPVLTIKEAEKAEKSELRGLEIDFIAELS
jgi:hypothetical protein